MPEPNISELKRNVVAIGRLLWEKELVSALNGNISVRVDAERILLTATKTCLGLLQEKDVLLMHLNGTVLEEGEVSSEKPLHTEIYRHFPEAGAVIHTHTLYANAYFLENDTFSPRIFESKFWFGELRCVEQFTPTVTDVAPTISALRKNSIAVLRNHGVVTMAKDLFGCFLLIQTLEDAMKTEAMSCLFKSQVTSHPPENLARPRQNEVLAGKSQVVTRPAKVQSTEKKAGETQKYKLFSKEQISKIVKLVNADKALKELGKKTQMTLTLGVKSEDSGKVYNLHFSDGHVSKVTSDDKAEFLLSAPDKVWRQVFNREIDPFVATTQKKITLKGDFGKLSKWYAPFQSMFQVWQQVPVE